MVSYRATLLQGSGVGCSRTIPCNDAISDGPDEQEPKEE